MVVKSIEIILNSTQRKLGSPDIFIRFLLPSHPTSIHLQCGRLEGRMELATICISSWCVSWQISSTWGLPPEGFPGQCCKWQASAMSFEGLLSLGTSETTQTRFQFIPSALEMLGWISNSLHEICSCLIPKLTFQKGQPEEVANYSLKSKSSSSSVFWYYHDVGRQISLGNCNRISSYG